MTSFGSYSKPLGNGVNITGEYDLTTGRQLTGSVTANPFGTASATYAPQSTLAGYDSQFPTGPALPPGYGSLKPPQPLPLPNDFTPPPASAMARKPPLVSASATPGLDAFHKMNTAKPTLAIPNGVWDFSKEDDIKRFAVGMDAGQVSEADKARAIEHINQTVKEGNPFTKAHQLLKFGLMSVDDAEKYMQDKEDERIFGRGYVRPEIPDSTVRYYNRKALRSSRNPVERELGRRTTRGATANARNGYDPSSPIASGWWGSYKDPMGEAY